jgi:hypothetical protein
LSTLTSASGPLVIVSKWLLLPSFQHVNITEKKFSSMAGEGAIALWCRSPAMDMEKATPWGRVSTLAAGGARKGGAHGEEPWTDSLHG